MSVRPSVIVIGAGLAGLAAADELWRAGADVEVFEARDRVGGRVHSVPFAGAVVEFGAEFVLPGNSAVTGLAERFGLELVRKGTLYGDREPRGGDPVERAELIAALQQIAAAPASPPGTTVTVGLNRLGLSPHVAVAIRARLEVSCAYPTDDLDAAALAEGAAAFGDFDSYTVRGGNDRLARELAAQLEDNLHLWTPVHRVAWSEHEVRVHAGDGIETAADAAIVAVPATVLDAIDFDPGLPFAKVQSQRAVRYGQAAKLFVALRAPVPPSAILSVPDRFWCYTQLGHDGEPLPFVGAFAGSPSAIESLGIDRGPDEWLERLARLRPDLELDVDAHALSRWDDDPWARGAYSARSASSPLNFEELTRPVGPLSFAGEHTAGPWHGLMEGAIRSGVRAADEVLARRAGAAA
jgi:monoamine oxidase